MKTIKYERTLSVPLQLDGNGLSLLLNLARTCHRLDAEVTGKFPGGTVLEFAPTPHGISVTVKTPVGPTVQSSILIHPENIVAPFRNMGEFLYHLGIELFNGDAGASLDNIGKTVVDLAGRRPDTDDLPLDHPFRRLATMVLANCLHLAEHGENSPEEDWLSMCDPGFCPIEPSDLPPFFAMDPSVPTFIFDWQDLRTAINNNYAISVIDKHADLKETAKALLSSKSPAYGLVERNDGELVLFDKAGRTVWAMRQDCPARKVDAARLVLD